MEKNKSSVHPTNSPLLPDANEGSHLPINIDPELTGRNLFDAALFVFLMGEAEVELRLETLELPDVLTSDGELQQPGPRRSCYGRLLKPRKELNDSC
ncbi:hypothetical protein TNCV_4145461 [Trichonephila clavipes]|nr:hypothetical protein TNCV_4145461 [Trichonephila clavipes]